MNEPRQFQAVGISRQLAGILTGPPAHRKSAAADNLESHSLFCNKAFAAECDLEDGTTN